MYIFSLHLNIFHILSLVTKIPYFCAVKFIILCSSCHSQEECSYVLAIYISHFLLSYSFMFYI